MNGLKCGCGRETEIDISIMGSNFVPTRGWEGSWRTAQSTGNVVSRKFSCPERLLMPVLPGEAFANRPAVSQQCFADAVGKAAGISSVV